MTWRKSSFSNGGTACIEVARRKSTFSNNGNACIEVAPAAVGVGVRDSKNTTGPTLSFPTKDWRSFLAAL